MDEVIDYYQNTVEPAFAYLCGLRNKKASISYYLRHHHLPSDVRRSLIEKIDRLEHMIREAQAPYRKKRRYYQMLDKTIKDSVEAFVNDVPDGTVTVVERLDIKEFNKSRKVNGMLSVFTRGKLSQKLTETLNWNGKMFIQVEPDYSSQVCPCCQYLNSDNRNGKKFKCLSCGFESDADNVGALNLKARAEDKEFLSVCEKDKYNHKQLQKDLILLYAKRHAEYAKEHLKKAS